MTGFQTPVDIANRALQHCGVELISITDGFNEQSDRAEQCSFAYDKLRKAELRRNYWQFAIKRCILRPVDVNTRLLAPTLWASTTQYTIGDLVTDAMGNIWISQLPINLNYEPGNSTAWEMYYGPIAIPRWDTTGLTSYYAGEVVYTTPGDGTYKIYMSNINVNTDNPATATAWSATSEYTKDAIVTYLSVQYQSLIDFNLNQTPNSSPSAWTTTITRGAASTNWVALGAILQPLAIMYPVGAGPLSQAGTRNVFRMPANHLRQAPQAPKAGVGSFLGAPTGLPFNDWELSGPYLITNDSQPFAYRFVADITNVRDFDDMFCEGLAARLGYEVCPKLTQSVSKRSDIAAAYKTFMGEARIVSGIDGGATEQPEDELLTVRQ